jgi:hypothetical protein
MTSMLFYYSTPESPDFCKGDKDETHACSFSFISGLRGRSSDRRQKRIADDSMTIKVSISSEDWAKVSDAITRLMGIPTMQGTEVTRGQPQLSDGTEVSHGEWVAYRQSSWAKGTITVFATVKVAPETEPIEVEVTMTDTGPNQSPGALGLR